MFLLYSQRAATSRSVAPPIIFMVSMIAYRLCIDLMLKYQSKALSYCMI